MSAFGGKADIGSLRLVCDVRNSPNPKISYFLAEWASARGEAHGATAIH